MKVKHLPATPAFVKIVDVLSYQREIRNELCHRGDRSMRGIGFRAQYSRPTPFVPTPDERWITLKGSRVCQFRRMEVFPEAGLLVAEGGYATFRGYARSGENDDPCRSPQRIDNLSVHAAHPPGVLRIWHTHHARAVTTCI